ncbi:cyclin B [Apiospora hydei]|uniref:Cyclin B n=1 Tax=Apiospora hydei TaxID=1337664 RepID=A0ABR1X130_9PEZI
MPAVGRTTRQRGVLNENDENGAPARMTRAKAAALEVEVTTKPLQSKKSAVNANPTTTRTKRSALGDVTNAGKSEVVEGKKPAATKTAGLVSKASYPVGVKKTTRAAAARAPVATKEAAPKARTGSGVGSANAANTTQKRKVLSSTAVKPDVVAQEEPARKKPFNPDAENQTKPQTKLAKVEEVPEKVVKVVDDVKPEPADEKDIYPPGVTNLDSEDMDDPLMAAEYATEIFEYLRDLEVKSVPNPEYMEHQDDLEWKTRGILVDWLIEVHTRFHLLPETLFLAVNIIDRFLSAKVVQLDRLQLVGITAMFIASKYEEVLSPHVQNFVHVADDGFTEAEILSAERFILGTLEYDLSYPNPMNFLRRISKADNYDIQSRTIGKYLMEISLLDHRFMAYRPSHVAAAAMFLARMILDRGEWDPTLSYYAGYTEEEIEPVFELMVDYLARPVIHEAFYKKYASKKFLKASLLTRQWAKKNAPIFGITDTSLSLDEISS